VCCSVLQCVAVCGVHKTACFVYRRRLVVSAACCSTLQRVAACCNARFGALSLPPPPGSVCSMLQCVAACCTVLQCVVVHHEARPPLGSISLYFSLTLFLSSSLPLSLSLSLSTWRALAPSTVCSVLQLVAVWCSVEQMFFQCILVCCSVLQCVAVCCSGL